MPVTNPTSLYQLELLCPSFFLPPLTNPYGFIGQPFTKASSPNNTITLIHASTNSTLHHKRLVQQVCGYPGLQLPSPSKLHMTFSSPRFALRKLPEQHGASSEQSICQTAFWSAGDAQTRTPPAAQHASSFCPQRVHKIPPPQPQIHRDLSHGLV